MDIEGAMEGKDTISNERRKNETDMISGLIGLEAAQGVEALRIMGGWSIRDRSLMNSALFLSLFLALLCYSLSVFPSIDFL